MEAQGQHDPQKSNFLEREIRGRTSSDNIRVEQRMISVTELLLKFMTQAQGIFGQVTPRLAKFDSFTICLSIFDILRLILI